MFNLIIPGTELKFEDLDLEAVKYVAGGSLIIKLLPWFPPVNCDHQDCYELADYAIMLITADEEEDRLTLNCAKHYRYLLWLQAQNIPLIVTH